jgi:hypothetical protein
MSYPRDEIRQDKLQKTTLLFEGAEKLAFEIIKHTLLLVTVVSLVATSFSFLASGLSIRGLTRVDFLRTFLLVILSGLVGGTIAITLSSRRNRRVVYLKRKLADVYSTALDKSRLNPLSKDQISESPAK